MNNFIINGIFKIFYYTCKEKSIFYFLYNFLIIYYENIFKNQVCKKTEKT